MDLGLCLGRHPSTVKTQALDLIRERYAGVEAARASLERVRHFFDTPATPAPAFHGPRAQA